MASPEDVIEPLAESAAAQSLNRRRFSHDCHDLTKDELDGLMSRSEGRPFIVVHRLSEIEDKGIPYFIPDVPVKCRLDNTEKHTTRSRVPP